MEIIRQLKEEHAKFARELQACFAQGIDSKEGRATFTAIQGMLKEHFKREDEEFYPELYKLANHNPPLKAAIAFFTLDMHNISGKVMDFIETLPETKDPKELELQFLEVFGLIDRRMQREERILFKTFEHMREQQENYHSI